MMTQFAWSSNGVRKSFRRSNEVIFLKQFGKRCHLEKALKLNRMETNSRPFAPYFGVRNFHD